MWRIRVADLRDSWPAWGGVSLAFVTANYAFATLALIINSGFVAVASGGVTLEKSAGFTVGPLTIVIMMCFVASTVIGAATALVITARRSALARLALAQGNPDLAADEAGDAARIFEAEWAYFEQAQALRLEAQAHLSAGNAGTAAHYFTLAAAVFERIGNAAQAGRTRLMALAGDVSR